MRVLQHILVLLVFSILSEAKAEQEALESENVNKELLYDEQKGLEHLEDLFHSEVCSLLLFIEQKNLA